jgi:hypothetical protein
MRWEEAGGVRYAFLDREKISWSKKLNLLWWFGNDSEQTVYQADWYHPGWTQWRRKLMWNLRNPLQNFRAYVLGVQLITSSLWFTAILIHWLCNVTT